MADTRAALERFSEQPQRTLRPWLLLSLGIAALLLVAVWAVAVLSVPDPSPIPINGVSYNPALGDYFHILYRNSLVLALHAMACVAGFMAGSSLPLSAENRSGLDRWVHEKAGPAAIVFVAAATVFSLSTQAYFIGGQASTIAEELHISPALLVVGLLPHAVPELVALFLPLAAWLIASHQRRWNELLAATVVCVSLAVPVLLASAAIELWVSPHFMRLLAGV
jgi:hypothetical protein